MAGVHGLRDKHKRVQKLSVKSSSFINNTFQPSDASKNNIAVLILNEPIQFNFFDGGIGDANKICLLREKKFVDKTEADLYSWTKIGGIIKDISLKKKVLVISSAACRADKRFNKHQHICLKKSEKSEMPIGEQPLLGSPLANTRNDRHSMLGFVVGSGDNYFIATKIDAKLHDWIQLKLVD